MSTPTAPAAPADRTYTGAALVDKTVAAAKALK